MDAFYKISILVAIVFLILILTVIGILISQKSNVLTYPPVANQCPDFWAYDGSYCVVPNTGCKSGNNKTIDCTPNMLNGISVQKLETTKIPGLIKPSPTDNTYPKKYMIDFTDSGWAGTCGKTDWVRKADISWDGVSNYNSCE